MYSDPRLDLLTNKRPRFPNQSFVRTYSGQSRPSWFIYPNNVINAISYYAKFSIFFLFPLLLVSSLLSGTRNMFFPSYERNIRRLFNSLREIASLFIFIV